MWYSIGMADSKQATVLPARRVSEVRKQLPEQWKRAAGMMRHHARWLKSYIARVRKEWE